MTVLHAAKASTKPHVHIAGEQCPLCEQPIPNERYEEISKRIKLKERERQAAADAKAKTEIDAIKSQTQAQIDAMKAEAAAKEAAALVQGRKAAEDVFAARLTEAAEATKAATERGTALQAQLEAARAETAVKEAAGVEQGKKLAAAAFDVRLAAAAEATKTAAEKSAALQAQLDQSRSQLTSTVEKMTTDFAAREAAIRTETRQAAEDAAQAKLLEAEQGRQAAEQKVAVAEATHQQHVSARLTEQREALEKSSTEAVNAERSKAFEEKMKLEGIVDELKRKLENKTADELGEGAEIDLYEELKAEFPEDDIQRVGKGKAGADIIHKVRHKGQTCGCIIYDSKNHQQWRSAHVAKLREDQIHAKADHAILSTHAFPSGARQLHIENNVIMAKPARAIAVAMMIRKHMVEMHGLRVSSEERVKKADELYAWITSARFNQFLDSITKAAEELEELQLQERKALEPLWKKQGERIRSIIRSRVQLGDEVDRIIGTAQ